MKPTALLLAVFCAFSLFPASLSAQTLYPMTCGVGGAMQMILSPRGDKTFIQLRFRKARQAASVVRPGPGECAWWDRPINSAEPSLMGMEVKAELWTSFRAAGSGFTSVGVVSKRSDRDEQETARFLLDATRRGDCFVVNTFNTRRGFFEIRSVARGC